MKDTSKNNERLFTRRLMEIPPEHRLSMACGMFSAARELVRAGISASGEMSASELRAEIFLRIYGRDFDRDKLSRILAEIKSA